VFKSWRPHFSAYFQKINHNPSFLLFDLKEGALQISQKALASFLKNLMQGMRIESLHLEMSLAHPTFLAFHYFLAKGET